MTAATTNNLRNYPFWKPHDDLSNITIPRLDSEVVSGPLIVVSGTEEYVSSSCANRLLFPSEFQLPEIYETCPIVIKQAPHTTVGNAHRTSPYVLIVHLLTPRVLEDLSDRYGTLGRQHKYFDRERARDFAESLHFASSSGSSGPGLAKISQLLDAGRPTQSEMRMYTQLCLDWIQQVFQRFRDDENFHLSQSENNASVEIHFGSAGDMQKSLKTFINGHYRHLVRLVEIHLDAEILRNATSLLVVPATQKQFIHDRTVWMWFRNADLHLVCAGLLRCVVLPKVKERLVESIDAVGIDSTHFVCLEFDRGADHELDDIHHANRRGMTEQDVQNLSEVQRSLKDISGIREKFKKSTNPIDQYIRETANNLENDFDREAKLEYVKTACVDTHIAIQAAWGEMNVHFVSTQAHKQACTDKGFGYKERYPDEGFMGAVSSGVPRLKELVLQVADGQPLPDLSFDNQHTAIINQFQSCLPVLRRRFALLQQMVQSRAPTMSST